MKTMVVALFSLFAVTAFATSFDFLKICAASENIAVIQSEAAQQQKTGSITEQRGITSLQFKLIALALLGNTILTIYFHKTDKLIIYADYTDATVTSIIPLISIGSYLFLRFFEMPQDIAKAVSIGFFSILMFFVARSTFISNDGLSIFFLMSLITKVTIVALYYAITAAMLLGAVSVRRKGESYAAYEARKRRDAKVSAAAISTATGGFLTLSAWVCKSSEFTSIKKYFSSNDDVFIETNPVGEITDTVNLATRENSFKLQQISTSERQQKQFNKPQEQAKRNWIAIGRKYIESNEYKKAVTALSNALKTDLNSEKVYYLRAVAYSKLAERQKALEDIKTAAELGHPKAIEWLQKNPVK